MKRLLALAVAAVSVQAHAQLSCTPSSPRTDPGAGFAPFGAAEQAVARGGNAGPAWEWAIGTDTEGSQSAKGSLDWVSGKLYAWTLIYSGAGAATIEVRDAGALVLSRTWAVGMDRGNAFQVQVSTNPSIGPGTAMAATVSAINGQTLAGAVSQSGTNTQAEQNLYYFYPQMAAGFTATGTVSLTYTGLPAGARVQFKAQAGNLPCTPGPTQAKLYFIHTDHLNAPRLIADEQQRTVWRWDNTDPFGGNPPDENPSGLGVFEFPLRFPGQYADRETQTAYNDQRDAYDAALGRYLQPDSLGVLTTGAPTLNPSLSHLYAYVDSDPIAFTDPDGLAKQRGGGNPRPSSAASSQGSAWVGQQGTWFRGQFYPRFGDAIVAPPQGLPRSRIWRDPGQLCIPESRDFSQPISGHALQNWISRPDRDIPARDIINAVNRGRPDLNSRPGTVTYYDPTTNTTVITNIFTGSIISFRRGSP